LLFQGDIIIKTAIELGIDDMRKNPWLIDDMYSDLMTNPYLKDKYGKKQVSACKEWLANNKIEFYMALVKDKDKMPCITISMGNSPEKQDMKTMADMSTETKLLMPNTIGKPIPYVVKPFVPTSYTKSTGILEIPTNIKGTQNISQGMILVDPATGNGYGILSVGPGEITIEADTNLTAGKYGIVPQFQVYKARVEHTFFQESYTIGCHAHGDPQILLWLWSITLYSLLRYRESLLEYSGFAESVFSNSDIQENNNYGGVAGEEVFTRYITITGQVENSWIKTPRRYIETITVQENTSAEFCGNVNIVSNENSPAFLNKKSKNWDSKHDDNEDEE
jgi:hypothetical protein